MSRVGPGGGARGAEVLVGADEELVVAPAPSALPAESAATVAAAVAPGQRADEVADPELRVEAGGGRAVHQVGDPAAADALALAGVELGAVARVGHQVVGGVLGHLGADPVVRCNRDWGATETNSNE